jgi:drug/metabolite transporter (DMT)-like permease
MPLADANSVTFLSVIVAMLLSAAAFSEKISLLRWFSVGLAFVGALLIAKPGSTLFNPVIGLAFLAALFIGIETVLIKFLSDREKPMRILWFNNLVGAAISIPVIAMLWITPNASQWFALFGVGALMVFAQLLNILAMQRAGVSFVAPFWLLAPFFAAAYDLLIFDVVPSALTTAGMVLILIGGLLVYRSR